MAAFDDPLELFRVAVERMNANDFRGAAQCCDPVSLRAHQRASVARYAMQDRPRPLRIEDMMRGDSDMPREVAEYSLRKQQEAMALHLDVSMEFPGFESVEALRASSAEDVFAAFLEGHSMQHLMKRHVQAGHLDLRDVEASAALNAHRWNLAAIGVLEVSESLAHILYRHAPASSSGADADSDNWRAHEREHLATLPRDEQALYAELQGNYAPSITTCRRQPTGGWLLLAGYDFIGMSGAFAIGRGSDDVDEGADEDAAAD